MENKDNQKKEHDKTTHGKPPLKDLRIQKEQADKVQGGTVAMGNEANP